MEVVAECDLKIAVMTFLSHKDEIQVVRFG